MAVNNLRAIGALPKPDFIPPPELTPEELAAIQAKLHLRIYEPLVAHAEIVIDDNSGDLMMEWGGRYAS